MGETPEEDPKTDQRRAERMRGACGAYAQRMRGACKMQCPISYSISYSISFSISSTTSGGSGGTDVAVG